MKEQVLGSLCPIPGFFCSILFQRQPISPPVLPRTQLSNYLNF